MAALAGGAKGPGGKSLTPCRGTHVESFMKGGRKRKQVGLKIEEGERRRERKGERRARSFLLKGTLCLCIDYASTIHEEKLYLPGLASASCQSPQGQAR